MDHPVLLLLLLLPSNLRPAMAPKFRYDDPKIPHFSSGEEEEEEGENGGEESSSSQGQNLKGHLNGLYRGFTSIIQSTAQVDPDKRQVPFEVEKAMHNIMFIKHHMKRQDEFDAVSQDEIEIGTRNISIPNPLFYLRRTKTGASSPWCWTGSSCGSSSYSAASGAYSS